MTAYTPSARAKSAVATLLFAVEDEAVPDTHLFAEDGLSREYQRALAVLRACAGSEQRVVAAQAKAEEPMPQRIQSRFGGGEQEVRSVDLAKLHGFFDQSEPLPLPTAPPEHGPETELQAEPTVANVALPTPEPQKDEKPAVPVQAPPASPSPFAVRRSVNLANARAGQDYSDRLEIEGERDLKLITAGRSGLVFDEVTSVFSGTPTEAGDHELRLKGRIDDRPAEITVNFAVVADPKTLWTTLPSDEADPFWKPDEAFTALDGPGLRMLGASKRGRSHAKTGGFREDDYSFALHGDWHIAAVADGAGSARFSRRGSKLAVETVTAALPPLIDEHLGSDFEPLLARHLGSESVESDIATRLYHSLVAAAYKAAEALVAQAEQLGESPSKLSTTIIIVIARRFGARWFVGSFSIGDGGAAVWNAETGTVKPLTAPDAGEYAGQTRFLAKSEFADPIEVIKRLNFATPERFTAIALMSDGITDPKLPTDKAFADPATWMTLWRDDLTKEIDFSAPDAEIEAKFLAWLDFWSPGNHDDRTLVVLLPKEG